MTWAILLAAGQGTRLSQATGGVAKQFLQWRNAPLYWESARRFAACPGISGVVFVLPPELLEAERQHIEVRAQADFPDAVAWTVVAGGALRQDSVRNGLHALPDTCRHVLVHDAARPFLTQALIVRVLAGLSHVSGVIPAIPVVDTIKVVNNGLVVATPERQTLRAVQTPQGFDREVLCRAHAQAHAEGWTVTDDASLLERCGESVLVVEGLTENKKITNPEDLQMLSSHVETRTGFGYDVHKYAVDGCTSSQPARPMRLGGVLIPEGPQVFAHSDGDVLLHALMDALLGCAGEGDIGQLFPDSSTEFDNIDSSVLLDKVLTRLIQKQIHITHVDATIIAQIPKVSPYRDDIRKRLAARLSLSPERIAVKATTEEGLGFTGEKKGIKAVVVVTAESRAAFSINP